jgi:hypothetical protein
VLAGKELKSTTLKSLTDLLNAVAPPIAEHEVIQVSLSHGMKGYDGVETLVYRGLAKVSLNFLALRGTSGGEGRGQTRYY